MRRWRRSSGEAQAQERSMYAQRPLISVIIPCFNYERYVREAIDSVLAQRGADVEVIVVDDGSTDGSWAEILTYGDQLTAIRTENGGALRACLTGFRRSTGAFVYFLDADDVLAPGALATIRPHLQPEVSKIQFMLLPIDAAGAEIGRPFPQFDRAVDSPELIELIRRRGSYASPPTSGNIYRRDVYEDLGDMSYERAIDGVPYLLAPFVGRVVSINQPLGKYRIHNANLSAFSVVSSDRMDYYLNRFLNRLKHLNALLANKSLQRGFELKRDYAYVGELRLMRSVVAGKRPQWRLVRSYLRSLNLEQTGGRRLLQATFALLLYGLPVQISAHLIRVRLNPSAARRLRAGVKSLLNGAPEPSDEALASNRA
jgi:glycosyltransferase involved in cell wall biosynthesis